MQNSSHWWNTHTPESFFRTPTNKIYMWSPLTWITTGRNGNRKWEQICKIYKTKHSFCTKTLAFQGLRISLSHFPFCLSFTSSEMPGLIQYWHFSDLSCSDFNEERNVQAECVDIACFCNPPFIFLSSSIAHNDTFEWARVGAREGNQRQERLDLARCTCHLAVYLCVVSV